MNADEEGSEQCGAIDVGERSSYVRKKLRGKRPTIKVPSPKRRKMVRASWGEEGLVNIGGSGQSWRRQMVLLDSSDDDGPAVPPPPSTEAPPLAVPASAET